MPQEECGGLVAPLGAQIEGPPAFGQRGMLAPSRTVRPSAHVSLTARSTTESNWERSLH